MAAPSETGERLKCPVCGDVLEEGYVLGLPGASATPFYLGQIPTTIGWLGRPPAGRGWNDQLLAEPLAPVGITIFNRDPRFPAWRCRRCRRVEFDYEGPDYGSTAAAERATHPE